MDSLVGKTIARVEESTWEEWGQSTGLVVWFTDGTAVRIEPTGWEVEGIELHPTTAASLDADRTANIESEIDHAWTQHERVLDRVRETIAMATAYGVAIRFGPDGCRSCEGAPGDVRRFERWYQERYGLSSFGKALKAEYQDGIRAILNDANRLMFGGQQ